MRYPRGSHKRPPWDDPLAPIVDGRAEVLRTRQRVAILALGNTVDAALDAYDCC